LGKTYLEPWGNVKKLHEQANMLEDDANGKGDETKLSESK